jgi:hypothetical protein
MATRYLNFDAATNGAGTIGSPWNDFDTAQAGIARGDTVVVSGYLGGSMIFDPAKGGVSPAAKTKWLGTVDNPFVVSGGQRLTGWVQCAVGDQADVGSNFASIWKTTVTTSSLPGSNPFSANICEAGAQIPICVSRALTEDKFFVTRPQYYHVASSVTLAGAQVTGFRLPAVTDLFTKLQIDRSRIYFVAAPNVSAQSNVTFDAGTKVISLVTPATYENSAVTTTTIYCWPQNVASLAGVIEYSARDVGINLNGTSNLEIGFFKTRQCAGNIGASGNLFNTAACSHVYLHNFESTDMLNYGGAQAAVYMTSVNNLEMAYFDVRRSQGAFGIFCQGTGSNAFVAGGAAPTLMSGCYIHHFTVAFTSSGPFRQYTFGNSIVAFGIYWECARQSHGNTQNAYQSSHNLLWWGIDGEDSDGFFTYQESDSIVMAFCSASASRAPSGGARGIYEQTGAHREVGSILGFKPSYLFNCRATPNGLDGRLSNTNSIKWADSGVPNDRASVWNNVIHGDANDAADMTVIDEWDHNVTTAGAARGANDVLTTTGATYVNAALNDFRYTSSSIVRTKPGKNLTATIAALQARFELIVPGFTDWNKDMVGDTFNAATPGVGPTVNKDAVYGQDRNITYAGIVGGSNGGGGEPTRAVISPGFQIVVAA